jgi:hypothetical protein
MRDFYSNLSDQIECRKSKALHILKRAADWSFRAPNSPFEIMHALIGVGRRLIATHCISDRFDEIFICRDNVSFRAIRKVVQSRNWKTDGFDMGRLKGSQVPAIRGELYDHNLLPICCRTLFNLFQLRNLNCSFCLIKRRWDIHLQIWRLSGFTQIHFRDSK